MGYDAFVPCNCYREKKTTEPPYKECVVVDEGGRIDLEIPSELCWQRDQDLIARMDQAFDQWKKTACEHENMDYCSRWIATMRGMAYFRTIISELGDKTRFPVLSKFLPTCNDGIVPSERAEEFLAELQEINQIETLREISFVRNMKTAEIVAMGFWEPYEKWIGFQYDFEFQVGKQDVRLIEKRPKSRPYDVKAPVSEFPEIIDQGNRILFRSSHYIQKRIAWDHYILIDKESEKRCECFSRVDSEDDEVEFQVFLENRPINEFFQYCLVPLITLAEASIATGNPINWC